MRARNALSPSQCEQLVALFEAGSGYRAAANQLGVGRSVRGGLGAARHYLEYFDGVQMSTKQ